MTTDGGILVAKTDELIAQRTVVEVYRERIAREPLVGRVLQQSPSVFLMEKLDELYRYDGVVAARPADITRLRIGGRELEMGARVAPAKKKKPVVLPRAGLLEISSAITLLNKKFGYVVLFVESIDDDVCFIGEELAVDDDFVLIREYGTLRSMDRSELLVRIDEITRVDADGQYERQLVGLFSESRSSTTQRAPRNSSKRRRRASRSK
jgi:hypothetical protein